MSIELRETEPSSKNAFLQKAPQLVDVVCLSCVSQNHTGHICLSLNLSLFQVHHQRQEPGSPSVPDHHHLQHRPPAVEGEAPRESHTHWVYCRKTVGLEHQTTPNERLCCIYQTEVL